MLISFNSPYVLLSVISMPVITVIESSDWHCENVHSVNSSVGLVTRIQVQCLNSRKEFHLLESVKSCLRDISIIPFYGYWVNFCGGSEQNWQRHYAEHLRPPSANVKCSHTSTPVYTFMAWKGKIHAITQNEGPDRDRDVILLFL